MSIFTTIRSFVTAHNELKTVRAHNSRLISAISGIAQAFGWLGINASRSNDLINLITYAEALVQHARECEDYADRYDAIISDIRDRIELSKTKATMAGVLHNPVGQQHEDSAAAALEDLLHTYSR